MKTINIAGAIDEILIFDDPEYCESEDKCNFVSYVDNSVYECRLFGNIVLSVETDCFETFSGLKKCLECKAVYQKALSKRCSIDFNDITNNAGALE